LFPDEDDLQKVMLAFGLYQKLFFQDPAFRRFTSEYSSEHIHAGTLHEYANTASKAYEVTMGRVGRQRADFLFTAYKGMDCYIEPYLNERIDELSFEEVYENISAIYYHFIPRGELADRRGRALAALTGVKVGCERFVFSIEGAAEAKARKKRRPTARP
jgi:hypothetical protein